MYRLFFTLLVGPITVAVIDGIGSVVLQRNLFADESDAIVQRSILIAVPFVVLLIFNVRNKACWIAPALAT